MSDTIGAPIHIKVHVTAEGLKYELDRVTEEAVHMLAELHGRTFEKQMQVLLLEVAMKGGPYRATITPAAPVNEPIYDEPEPDGRAEAAYKELLERVSRENPQ